MIPDSTPIWLIIVLLGLGTFGLRFSFLGFIGDRQMPPWVLRHLRYTAVAVFPGLVAPMVFFPEATGGTPDPSRLACAAVTLGVAYVTKSVLWAFILGGATLYGLLYLLG
ncbi:MAG: AzlD domain-containing protein [Pseudomonadota bacterium]